MFDEPVSTRADEVVQDDFKRDYVKEVQDAKKRIAYKQAQGKFIKDMARASETQRWRLAVDWLLRTNPEAKTEHNAVVAELKETRDLQGNKFAASKYMRHGFSMPQMVFDTLMLTDPNIDAVWTSGTPHEKKKMLHKIMRTFPEYRAAQVV